MRELVNLGEVNSFCCCINYTGVFTVFFQYFNEVNATFTRRIIDSGEQWWVIHIVCKGNIKFRFLMAG